MNNGKLLTIILLASVPLSGPMCDPDPTAVADASLRSDIAGVDDVGGDAGALDALEDPRDVDALGEGDFGVLVDADAEIADLDAGLADAEDRDALGPVDAGGAPRVFFVDPVDGDVVLPSTFFRFGVEYFQLASIIDPVTTELEGHLHFFIDDACVAPGEVATPSDHHMFDLVEGEDVAFVTLEVGRHALCLQAANRGHAAFAAKAAIQIVVAE